MEEGWNGPVYCVEYLVLFTGPFKRSFNKNNFLKAKYNVSCTDTW